ncbi:MAG: hypothetical protein AAB545_02640 [Patescibacteria group bacterium]
MKQDIPYALDLLKRINGITINEAPIYSFFSKYYNGDAHSFWASQMFSLFGDIKAFSAEKNFEKFLSGEMKNTFLHFLKYTIALCTSFVISMLFLLKVKMRGYRVLVYSPDKLKKGTNKDPRLFQIYPVFDEEKISYGEVIHTLLNREFLENLFKRKRLVFYLESLSLPFFFLRNRKKEEKYRNELLKASLAHFSKEELPFVHYILEKYLKRCLLSEFRIAFFSRMLREGGVKELLTIDDARYANELIVGARMSGVKVSMFQHSNFDYFYGLDALPPSLYAFHDTFFMWNDYWLARIQELSPLFSFHKSRLKIGGRMYEYAPKIRGHTPALKEELTILIPYEVNVDKSEIREFLQKVLSCPGTKVLFKVRADMPLEKQANEYGIDSKGNDRRTQVLTTLSDEIYASVHLVLGVYSGLLDEMVERGIPVVLLKTSYPLMNDLSAGGMTGSLSIEENNMCEKLRSVVQVSQTELLSRRERFMKGTGDARSVVREILRSL